MEPTWKLKKVTLFVSGVCTTDRTGPGSWACRLHFNDVVSEMFGYDPQTTANQMALRAALEGLKVIKERCRVTVLTTSEYLQNGMTRWLPIWKTNGRQTKTGAVKNQELWKELGEAAAQHVMRWWMVKPNSADIEEYQTCEKLATEAAAQQISSSLVRKLPERVTTAMTPEAVTSGGNGEKIVA